MKKRNLLFIAALALFISGLLIVGCEEDPLNDCQNCKAVTRDGSGNIVSEEATAEYCDEDLDEILASEPVVVGDNTTEYECTNALGL